MTHTRDTIFALSSGRPPAAIAVIRISGPRARNALEALIGRVPEPRKATLARVCHPSTHELIDQALALWFPGPRSETGEDGCELQLHGGRAVIAAVLAALDTVDGLRLAEPGEFTRRAFDNGRLDLTQVEALADLIYAETEAQRRQALGQLRGLLGERAENWRARLIEASALIEAGLDFSDEGDVPDNLLDRAQGILRPLTADVSDALASAARGERLREGLWVVIAGPPNAGKSTLLNRLARREAAIVSPQAGTTRDLIEVHLDLDGYPVNVVDTAGIRDPALEGDPALDPVEREGMRRARAAAARANLVLWLIDAREADARALAAVDQEPLAPGAVRWVVINKMDLVDARQRAELERLARTRSNTPPARAQAVRVAGVEIQADGARRASGDSAATELHGAVHFTSATTGAGLDDLMQAITRLAESFFTPEPALVTRKRQHALLSDVEHALSAAMTKTEQRACEEFIAEDLRHAMTALGKLTGRVDVEEILGAIFQEFCIGK